MEARRMNGKPYPAIADGPGERKAHTLANSEKGWIVGLHTLRREVNCAQRLLLVEGGPDYFAGLELVFASQVDSLTVATVLGTSVRSFKKEALAYLVSFKEILILTHNDQAGRDAAQSWKELIGPKARVLEWPDSVSAKDINQALASTVPEDWPVIAEVLLQ
jgi:hypothetical protein